MPQSKTHPSPDAAGQPTFWADLLASLVVFLVALPLCLGVALASGAPVSTGLVTGIIGGIVVGALAGSPLQVSGPAAGLTVICAEVIRQHGMKGLGAIALVAGAIQVVAGISRLGKWFRAVSPAVVHGMLSGIGVLILASQFHILVDDSPKGNGLQNILSIPESLRKGLAIPSWEPLVDRQSRLDLLKSLSQLQSRQNAIRAEVLRHIQPLEPDEHFAEEPASLPQLDWSDLAQRQSKLLSDLHAETVTIEQQLPPSDPLLAELEAHRQDAEQALQVAARDLDNGRVERLVSSQKAALAAMNAWLSSQKNHPWALILGGTTVLIIVLWNQFAKGAFKSIPGALLGIVFTSALAALLHLPVMHVGVPDNLTADLTWINGQSFQQMSVHDLLVGALVLATIASAETLLSATAVDKMHLGPRTNYNRELIAQGVGNLLCGCVGAIPITGVIVRSATNVQAGAKTRLSTILHGIWLAVFVLLLTGLVRAIPTSSLAGILVYTGFRLIDFAGFRKLWREHRAGAMIFMITLVVIVVDDLLTGVITGIVLSAVKLLIQFAQFEAHLTDSQGRIDLHLRGAATFLKLPTLTAELAKISRGREVHVDLEELTFVDHACLELLVDWGKQYSASGGQLQINWETLHSKFKPKLPPSQHTASI